MNIEDQIANLTNPQEFNHLCDVLFADIYGYDYEQIDDGQRDGGNDGYIRTKGVFYARHCFKRLSKSTQKEEILKKVRGDLGKVTSLIKAGYVTKEWYFVSSYRMPNDVRQEIIKLKEGCKFSIGCIGPAYLADELLKRPYLLQEFPFLHINQINQSLAFLTNALTNSNLTTGDATKIVESSAKIKDKEESEDKGILNQVSHSISGKPKVDSQRQLSKDYKKILEIARGELSPQDITSLKTIIYSSSDALAILQGVLALVTSYKFSHKTADEMLSMLDVGIDTSRMLNKLDAEAVLLAEKGSILSTQFCLLDLEGWGRVEMTNRSGWPIVTLEEKDEIVARLKQLNRQFNGLFKEAAEKSLSSKDYTAITHVFSKIGSAAGQRAGHFKSLNIMDRAVFEERMAKSAFMYAKSVCAAVRDEKELAYILHNFANMLGFLGETEEALGVMKRCLELARKHKMSDILSMAKDLERVIKEPKIKLGV